MGIVTRNIEKIDEALRNPAVDPLFTKMEATIKLPRKWVALGVIVMATFGLIIGYASALITNVLGFVYPAYESIKAVESSGTDDDTKWLTYWVVYSTIIILENFTDYLLFWIPFYFFLKIGLLVWCMHPSYNGTSIIYNNVIRPLFYKHEAKVDKLIQDAQKKGSSALKTAVNEVSELKDQALGSDAVKEATAAAVTAAVNAQVTDKKDD